MSWSVKHTCLEASEVSFRMGPSESETECEWV